MQSLLKINSHSDCVFQLILGLGDIILPLHLVTSTGFLNARLEYYSKSHIYIWFLNGINLAPTRLICVIEDLISMVPPANWHHPTSEHTKYSTYKQQHTGSKCSLWGMKMATTTVLVEFSFLSPMSASVIECRSNGSCSSSGLCGGLLITGLDVLLLLTCLLLTQNSSKGISKWFSRTCVIIQIKYVLPQLCHLPQ